MRDFWESRIARSPDAPFISTADAEWTYEEFDRWVNRLANGLAEAKITVASRVALLLPNGIELLRLQLALIKLGAVWIPIIPSLRAPEIRYQMGHSDADHLITDLDGWGELSQAGKFDRSVRVILSDSGAAGFEDLSALDSDNEEPPPSSGIAPADPMAIMYTSGSTGRPKGVLMPNHGIATVARSVAGRLATGADDCWYCIMPLFHSAATNLIVGPAVAVGASVYFRDRFSRTAFWDDIRKCGATVSILMPTMVSMLMTNPPSPDDRDHTLKTVWNHTRAPEFVERFGVDVVPGWGMTETMGVGALTPPGFDRHPPHMVGLRHPEEAQLKIVDENGKVLPANNRGELCVKHPHVFLGYYKDPEKTADTLRDGWVHTGDVASIDKDEVVYFHGRIKNMIKRGGENIAGEEIELAVRTHPAVEECIVCGVPDEIWIEEAYALVLLRQGHRLSPEEVAAWCRKHLAEWKVPRYVMIEAASLPTLPNGKPDRVTIASEADPERAWDRTGARQSV